MRIKFDIDKLVYVNRPIEKWKILSGLPIYEYLDRIISEGQDEVKLNPEEDKRLKGHKIRVFILKDACPPMIYVHLDGDFAAQLSYFGEKFPERSPLFGNW